MHTGLERLLLGAIAMLPASFVAIPAFADLVLETETSRLGAEGTGTIGNAVQFEHDHDGSIILTLTAFEYVWSDRIEILLEPFFYERQIPKDGKSTGGIGDTEFTVSWLASRETENLPALVFAGKVKIPTGDAPDIGTGKTDYTGYVILGKKIGNVDFSMNIAFETFGQPADEVLHDQVILDLSAEYPLGENWTVYAEVFGDSIPANMSDGTIAGAVAAEYKLTDHMNTFVSIGDDSDDLKVARLGVNYTW